MNARTILVISAIFVIGAAHGTAATTVIHDSVMSTSPWDDYQIIQPSGSHSYTLSDLYPGFPGTCMWLRMGHAGSGDYSLALMINDQPYDPGSQGTVTYLSYSFDVILDSLSSGSYLNMGLMLLQDGLFYRHSGSGVSLNGTGAWHVVAHTAILPYDTTIISTPFDPDNLFFNPGGSPIDFGFYAFLQGTNAGFVARIDNFRVKIWTTQPPFANVGDLDLDLSDWSAGDVLDWTGTGSFSLSGDFPGNPGSSRTIYMQTGSGGGYMTYHAYTNGAYAPASQGPLSQIDLNFETTISALSNLPNLRFGTMILQGSNLYIGTSQRNIAATAGWYALTFEALTPDSFSTFGEGPPQPDFSEGAQPLTFGITVTHLLISGATASTNRVDNFSVGLFGCGCACHADPSGCNGVQDITDVVQIVNVAFRGNASITDPNPSCPYERTDVNCTNSTDVLDVVKMVNVAFRGANAATEFCNPCP